MLRELHIENFAIIDTLRLDLERGFNILTGETGAGKSILIDAVTLVVGERADTSAIREGAETARVEAMFVLSPALQTILAPILEREGLEGDSPDTLWLARELRRTGRTIARVNGRAVSLAVLREVAENLVDVHGQSEHLSLLRIREHLTLLDRFAGLEPLQQRMAEQVEEIRRVRRTLADLLNGERNRMQRIDLLRFQVNEIAAANLKPVEKKELEAELVRLSNVEQLVNLTSGLVAHLEEGQERVPSVLDLLGRSQKDMASLARIDATLTPQAQALDEAVYQVEDLARALRDYIIDVEYNPKRQAWVEERLILLRHLERKYGADLEGVLAYAQRAAQELGTLEHSDERIAELQEEEARLLGLCSDLAQELSLRRREAAQRLTRDVEAELDALRMEGARFGVAFTWDPAENGVPVKDALPLSVTITREGTETLDGGAVTCAAFDASGIDQVEFLVAANIGEGLKSLARTASGGETARLMLALKAVLSRADRTPTLIFDEIDQGIGGRIGSVVGLKLWRLTSAGAADEIQHQVLCITHLPQLAGFGDAHYKVLKEVADGRTVANVKLLDAQARIAELAQMLGTQGATAERGAHEILQQAGRLKTAAT